MGCASACCKVYLWSMKLTSRDDYGFPSCFVCVHESLNSWPLLICPAPLFCPLPSGCNSRCCRPQAGTATRLGRLAVAAAKPVAEAPPMVLRAAVGCSAAGAACIVHLAVSSACQKSAAQAAASCSMAAGGALPSSACHRARSGACCWHHSASAGPSAAAALRGRDRYRYRKRCCWCGSTKHRGHWWSRQTVGKRRSTDRACVSIINSSSGPARAGSAASSAWVAGSQHHETHKSCSLWRALQQTGEPGST